MVGTHIKPLNVRMNLVSFLLIHSYSQRLNVSTIKVHFSRLRLHRRA